MLPSVRFGMALVSGLVVAGCATTGGRSELGARPAEIGIASYYAPHFHGGRTASGEDYDEHELTAAHRGLPFGTRVRVTNLANRRQVVLRVNDRGPRLQGRILDVSLRAARALGFVQEGITRVRVEVLGRTRGNRKA